MTAELAEKKVTFREAEISAKDIMPITEEHLRAHCGKPDKKAYFTRFTIAIAPRELKVTLCEKQTAADLEEELLRLYVEMWKQEVLPREFKDAAITHLYKNKGNRPVCDNHRGISLLAIAGKILARILLNRLQTHLESPTQDLPPDEQPSLFPETKSVQ